MRRKETNRECEWEKDEWISGERFSFDDIDVERQNSPTKIKSRRKKNLHVKTNSWRWKKWFSVATTDLSECHARMTTTSWEPNSRERKSCFSLYWKNSRSLFFKFLILINFLGLRAAVFLWIKHSGREFFIPLQESHDATECSLRFLNHL